MEIKYDLAMDRLSKIDTLNTNKEQSVRTWVLLMYQYPTSHPYALSTFQGETMTSVMLYVSWSLIRNKQKLLDQSKISFDRERMLQRRVVTVM